MEIPRVRLSHGLIVKCGACPCASTSCLDIRKLLRDCAEPQFEISSLPCSDVKQQPDLVVLQGTGATEVKQLRQLWDRSIFLGLFCPGASPNEVLRALHNGLDDFICCPFETSDLFPRVHRFFSPCTPSAARGQHSHFRLDSLIGEDEGFVKLITSLPRVAEAETTCVIYGETGTGKELIARAIHYVSPRCGKPFVPVNCGAVPDHLFENEVFGHAKGAFTDASTAEIGLVRVAEKGTLFLDEVDALSLSAQVKLLRFLQDREYRPLGSPQTIRGDVRVIAATNTCLRKKVQDRLFREDLFHRLNVLHLTVPALRDRPMDIPILAYHFLKKYAHQHRRNVVAFAPAALARLHQFTWPGNVRELEAVVERAVILSSGRLLQAADIDLPSVKPNDEPSLHPFQLAKQQTVRGFERAYVVSLLTTYAGNVSHAAKAAGKERRAFQRLMQRHGLARATFLRNCA
jgi:two-component system response regulator GlrR